MNDELFLFGDGLPAEPADPPAAEPGIADWQVELLRKMLTEQGHTTMEERQQAIETAAGRSVESLRALSHREALDVAERLGSSRPTNTPSSWDSREESTWIDEL